MDLGPPTTARGSNRLGDRLDRAARAFLGADAAALAIIEVELETHARPELDHGIVGTDAVAIVALEAVAAGQAPPRLEQRVGLIEACLLYTSPSPRD